jgi:GT2 family glycosyltransferase
MTKVPQVAVVILNWNGQNFLEKFLPSVTASTYPGLEIVVGDNASTDHSVQFLQKKYPSYQNNSKR